MESKKLPSEGRWISVGVGEVYIDSKKWGKIPLEEFKKRGGVLRFADNNEGKK